MIRIRLVGVGGPGGTNLTTFHYSGDGSGGDAQLAVNAVGVLWAVVDGFQATPTTWATNADVEVVDEVTGNTTDIVTTTPVTGAGDETGENLPVFVQGLIRLTTSDFVSGRRVRGRLFVPNMVEAFNTTLGLPLGTMTGPITTALGVWLAAVGPAPEVWSRTNGSEHVITSASMSPNWAYLGKRRS